MPMKNEPITLMIRMLNGKFVPNAMEIWFPKRYLNTAPSAPPIAIAIIVINNFLYDVIIYNNKYRESKYENQNNEN